MENNKRYDWKSRSSESKKHTTFLINNHYSSDSKIIANHFNEYFVKVGSSLANNIKSHTDPIMYVQQNKNTININ